MRIKTQVFVFAFAFRSINTLSVYNKWEQHRKREKQQMNYYFVDSVTKTYFLLKETLKISLPFSLAFLVTFVLLFFKLSSVYRRAVSIMISVFQKIKTSFMLYPPITDLDNTICFLFFANFSKMCFAS